MKIACNPSTLINPVLFSSGVLCGFSHSLYYFVINFQLTNMFFCPYLVFLNIFITK